MAWSQLVPLPRGVLRRQSTPCLSRQHSDTWTSPPLFTSTLCSYRSSGGRSGAQRCTAHTLARQTQACRNTSRRSRSLPAASRQRCSRTLQERENVCSALGVQDKAHGKMGLFMRFSNGHVGAALSVQTVISANFCTFSKMPTTPLLVFLQTLPEDSDSAVTLKLAEADCCCHPDCHYLCTLLSIFFPSKVSVSRAETVFRQFFARPDAL